MARVGGWSPRPIRNSEASFTVREKAGLASRRPASLRSCTSYSFMFEPQPAALTTTASRPWSLNASMVWPARCSAVFASPACEARAPQHTRADGTTTSQPLRASASAVRRLVPRNISSWMQPVSRPTRARRWPCAGVSAGSAGRAGGFAGAAVEALIDVGLKARVVERHQPQGRFLDLPHPPARAVALVMERAKGRALGQAEPAMNAVPDQVHVDAARRGRHAVALELRLEVERGQFRHQPTTRSRPRNGPG